MSMTRTRVFSLVDFQRLPEIKPPLEFYGGRIIQKMSPMIPHSAIQVDLILRLGNYAHPANLGRVWPELRCIFGESSYVFDICYYAGDKQPRFASERDAAAVNPPDLAIEILSPGQTVAEGSKKLKTAVRRGTRLGWLFVPKKREVRGFRPGDATEILNGDVVLQAEDILPGFSVRIAELFDLVDRFGPAAPPNVPE